jgi:hypothetical protein
MDPHSFFNYTKEYDEKELKNPDNFYYVYKNGKCNFYFVKNNKQIAVKYIPKETLILIKERVIEEKKKEDDEEDEKEEKKENEIKTSNHFKSDAKENKNNDTLLEEINHQESINSILKFTLEKQKEEITNLKNELKNIKEMIGIKSNVEEEQNKKSDNKPKKKENEKSTTTSNNKKRKRDHQGFLEREFEKRRKIEEKEKERKERKERWHRFFTTFNKNLNEEESGDNKPKPQSNNTFSEYMDLLNKHKISSKSDWKEWLKKNHPDKKGDNDLCAKINECARAMGWIK